MNISQLTELDYTGIVVAGVVTFLVLVTVTLLGYFSDYNRLRSKPETTSFFNTPSRLAARWLSFFVFIAALAFGALWIVSQQNTHQMSQDKVAEWMDLEYGIDELVFAKDGKDQITDRDNVAKPEEIVTGLMDGQRISMYFHESPDGTIHPMILDREVPKLFSASEDANEDSSSEK